MNKLIRFLNIVLIIFLVIMVFIIGFQAGQKYDIAVDENQKYVAISYSVNEQKMRRLMSLIDNHYVDDINTDSLVDNTISYILKSLDPHSVYLDNQISSSVSEDLKGYYTGIGIQYLVINDTMVITSVLESSPNRADFQFADRILNVEDSTATGRNLEVASEMIRGEINSRVDLRILRENDTINVRAKRAVIPRSSVPVAYMINEEMGYIKLSRFSENSYDEFHEALEKLLKKGMKALIFDLRGNPGGVMSVAEQIVDEFLTNDKLIVFTKDRQKKKNFRYATRQGDFENKPLYILIDETSASASEIVAGAIQDHDAGTIIGRRSFGKGLVQREISLGDGTKLRLTTARYFTPSGRSIQKPYTEGDDQSYSMELTERYKRGEMFSKDSIHINDSLEFKTSGGRIVFGGGGIFPDEFVPMDTVNLGKWFYERAHNGMYVRNMFQYLEKNKSEIATMSKEEFIHDFNPDSLAKELLRSNNLNINDLKGQNRVNFITYIKATIGNWLYGEQAYEEIWNLQDPMIQKAVEINNQNSPYELGQNN